MQKHRGNNENVSLALAQLQEVPLIDCGRAFRVDPKSSNKSLKGSSMAGVNRVVFSCHIVNREESLRSLKITRL